MKPKAPFTTASLQQTAYTMLGFSVKQTSSIAQRLYQGVDLGDGETVGLITYMRTDSTNLSVESLNELKSYLTEKHPKFCSEEARKNQTILRRSRIQTIFFNLEENCLFSDD